MKLSYTSLDGPDRDLQVVGDTLVVAGIDCGLRLFDIADPAPPVELPNAHTRSFA